MIAQAYTLGEHRGLDVWCEDEAGPCPTAPVPGAAWHPEGEAAAYPHEYQRGGWAKLLTLFHPRDGVVRVKGVESGTNQGLHPWRKQALAAIVAGLPPTPTDLPAPGRRKLWERWQEGLRGRITLPAESPPLRMLLVLDNLAGHKTPRFVCWCFAQGLMPLYTSLGGS